MFATGLRLLGGSVIACALVAAASLVASTQQVGQVASPTARTFDRAEFPSFDSAAYAILHAGMGAKAAAARFASAPDDPELPPLLMGARRFNDALAVLARIVERRPDRILAAFQPGLTDMAREAGSDFGPRLLSLVGAARGRLTELPREDAAALARRLIDVESRLVVSDRNARMVQLRAFASEYAGTEPAMLTEVDVVAGETLSVARLEALAAYAEAHPRTIGAAKALYQRGFDLAVNSTSLRIEPRGGDPTQRFKQVAAIVDELESGVYPACQWTRDAYQLLVRFSAFNAKYSSESNIDAVLDRYRGLVMKRLPGLADPTEDSANFVIATRMGDLFALRGDRMAGVERTYAAIAAVAPNPTAIRYAAALSYLRLLNLGGADRPLLFGKLRASLRAVHDENVQPFSRRALANLAAVHFHLRDHRAARAAYEEYLSRYADSDWAWVARLRLGQASAELEDFQAAVAAFGSAATTGGISPAARVVSLAFQADALVALGRIAEARAATAQAVSRWDDDAGESYRTQAQQEPLAGASPYAIPDDTTITRVALTRRLVELTVSASARGGTALEQARLLQRDQPERALPLLNRAVAESTGTSFERTARMLLNETRLRQALIRADGDRADRNPAEAIALLEAVGREPVDFAVTAARLARATLLAFDPVSAAGAEDVLVAALTALHAAQPLSQPPVAGTLEADVAAIRAAAFQPLGTELYRGHWWNAFQFPARLPSFLIANPDLLVKLADGTTRHVELRVPIPGLERVLFITRDEQKLLTDVITALGGRRQNAPTSIMQTPNLPGGAALDLKAFWNRHLAIREGHWSGWELESYPQIREIRFIDAERTRAAVSVTLGYSGGILMFVKSEGRWEARELRDFWIT